MRPGLTPSAHVFVCGNRREGSPLGPGCGDAGERVFTLLKDVVLGGGLARRVWITKTACLGLCPKSGTTVAVYPQGVIQTEVLPEDCPTIMKIATGDDRR